MRTDQLVDALSRLLAPRKLHGVWLFGSRAKAVAREDSDLDVGVLCEPALQLERAEIEDRLARQMGIDVDLVDMASCDPILAWEVITTGELLREDDQRNVEHFVRRARFQAEDADQRNRMILLAAGARR